MKIKTRVSRTRALVTAGVALTLTLSVAHAAPALAIESADAAQAAFSSQKFLQDADDLGKAIDKVAYQVKLQNMTPNEKVIVVAKKYRGVPYVAGGSTPSGFDCSGFTQYAYGKVGVKLSHNSQAQYNECGTKVARADLKQGDLVFFGGSTSSINHVGIYVGNGKYIHSPQTGDVVSIDDLSHRTNYVGAARPC